MEFLDCSGASRLHRSVTRSTMALARRATTSLSSSTRSAPNLCRTGAGDNDFATPPTTPKKPKVTAKSTPRERKKKTAGGASCSPCFRRCVQTGVFPPNQEEEYKDVKPKKKTKATVEILRKKWAWVRAPRPLRSVVRSASKAVVMASVSLPIATAMVRWSQQGDPVANRSWQFRQ